MVSIAMRPNFEPIPFHTASPAAALAASGCRRKVVVCRTRQGTWPERQQNCSLKAALLTFVLHLRAVYQSASFAVPYENSAPTRYPVQRCHLAAPLDSLLTGWIAATLTQQPCESTKSCSVHPAHDPTAAGVYCATRHESQTATHACAGRPWQGGRSSRSRESMQPESRRCACRELPAPRRGQRSAVVAASQDPKRVAAVLARDPSARPSSAAVASSLAPRCVPTMCLLGHSPLRPSLCSIWTLNYYARVAFDCLGNHQKCPHRAGINLPGSGPARMQPASVVRTSRICVTLALASIMLVNVMLCGRVCTASRTLHWSKKTGRQR